MRPHEENWAAHKDCVVEATSWKTVFVSHDGARDRAQLASAAPDMGRVLLAIEWSGCETFTDNECCPTCAATEREGHTAGCALDAALRKAGIR